MGAAKIIPANPDAIFLPYQGRWIADESRLKLMEKGRQIGISWSTAYAAVARTGKQGARLDQWVSSRDDIQARLFGVVINDVDLEQRGYGYYYYYQRYGYYYGEKPEEAGKANG